MSVDVYDDAFNKTRNRKSKVIGNDNKSEAAACHMCGNPRCGGCADGSGKVTKGSGQILQQIRNNNELDWRQRLDEPDSFIMDGFNERLGQTHHLIRENPLIRSAIKNERAHTIGPNVRLCYTPDHEALDLTYDWMQEAAALIEDMWERDMEDPVHKWNDASGVHTFSGQMGLSFESAKGSGEVLGLFYPEKNDGPTSFSTGLIDISRLTTPLKYINDDAVRHGKRLDSRGRATTYYISSELPGISCYNRFTSMARRRKELEWTAVKPFSKWGSPQLFHWYDKERPGQIRGVPEIATGLKRAHMIETLDETVIDAAIRDAAFALWVQSNSPNVGQAFSTNPGMSPGDFVEEVLGATTDARTDFYQDRKVELQAGQGMIAQLMTNESLHSLQVGSPTASQASFGRQMSNQLARLLGMDPYSFHGDMTGVNFSTIRAAFLQTWMNREFTRDQLFTQIGTPIFQMWLEDKIARGEFVIPGIRTTRLRQLNYFYENRRALTMCEFWGPGQESIDPIKGYKAQVGAIRSGLQTMDMYYKQFTNTTLRKAARKLKYEKDLLNGLDLFEYTTECQKEGALSDVGGGNSDRTNDQ